MLTPLAFTFNQMALLSYIALCIFLQWVDHDDYPVTKGVWQLINLILMTLVALVTFS